MKLLPLLFLALSGCVVTYYRVPPVAPSFRVGEHVAYTKSCTVWSDRSNPREFTVNKGDTGVVISIHYFGRPAYEVVYSVALDKAGKGQYMIAPAYETAETCWLEAVVYPDPALAPQK